MKSPRSHIDKMLVVHAIWLCAWGNYQHTPNEIIEQCAADLLRMRVEDLFVDFDYDYLDRAWCSRPTNWTPQDSLAQLQP